MPGTLLARREHHAVSAAAERHRRDEWWYIALRNMMGCFGDDTKAEVLGRK